MVRARLLMHAQIVLDGGRVVECGSPAALLQDRAGALRALVEESADKEALYAAVHGDLGQGRTL